MAGRSTEMLRERSALATGTDCGETDKQREVSGVFK